MPSDLGPDAGFQTMSTVIPVLIGVVFGLILVTVVYRAVRLARRGVNPLTLQEDVATRVLRSEAMAPRRTKGERLAEVDRLHADGAITDEERAAARDRILAE